MAALTAIFERTFAMPRTSADLRQLRFWPPPARVVRHDSDLARWEAVFRPAHPGLVGVVEGDYQGWVEHRASFASRREVPGSIVPIILNLGPDYRVIGPGQTRDDAPWLGSFVAGMHNSFALVESTGASVALQVNLTPIGAALVLDLPLGELTNRSVDLEDVLGSTARQLIDRLHGLSTWEARFDLLDAFLIGRLERARPLPAGVVVALERLIASNGAIRIGALAKEIGWSHKHLIARFREQVGLTPKMMARVLRFQSVIRRLDAFDGPRWAALAIDCGYCDQPHLIRDFVAFAGTTPREYLGLRLPDGGGVVGDPGLG